MALGGNYLLNSPQSFAQDSDDEALTTQSITLELPQNYVSNVVSQVGESVVRINASRKVATNAPVMFDDPFFRQLFGEQIPHHIPDEQIQQGMGSGFVVSTDGLIWTNAHVIEDSDQVEVTLKDGRTFKAEVMGTDSLTDIGVIKIDAVDLPAVKIADSDTLQPGEYAIAIGNPLGLNNTVTTGIVSATGRSSAQVGLSEGGVNNFIQTDAAINPGNSGGPLLNAKGEVMGINTAIIQGAQGLGFAIPVNQARDIADDLVTTGKVDHPYLGIQMAAITPEFQQQLKASGQKSRITEKKGVVIVDVVANSPASQAGLQVGDVIQKIDEVSVTKADEIQKTVTKAEIGTHLPIRLKRNGKKLNLKIQVGLLPASLNPI